MPKDQTEIEDFKKVVKNDAFSMSASTDAALKQYEVFVNANNVLLNRRQATHSLFITVNTVISSIGGYKLFTGDTTQLGLPILASIIGLLACYLWRLLLLLIKENINSRYNVIYEMENVLPLRPFTAELADLKTCTNRSKYLSSTRIEARIPFLFMLTYVALMGISVVSFILG